MLWFTRGSAHCVIMCSMYYNNNSYVCAPLINHCFQQLLMSLMCRIVTWHIGSTPVAAQFLVLFAMSPICWERSLI